MLADPWLNRWLPLLRERAGSGLVLEIGCGHGDDTATLAEAGLKVHAFDLSDVAVGITKARVPSAVVECRDIREPLPEQAHDLGAVVASLSLHYFSWAETQNIVQRIHSALRPPASCCAASTRREITTSAPSGYPEIEPNFFLVNGERKRFFDEASIDSLFSEGWNRLSLEHFVTSKYVKAKALWEVVLERSKDA